MRVLDVREEAVPISRYAAASAPAALTTSIVALVTDLRREGRPIVGYGFSSIGRFAQGGLIRERFAPRLLAATEEDLADPFAAWRVMMRREAGGHGERCVAVGALDMALWDAAAKAAEQPLYRYLAKKTGRAPAPGPMPVYGGGGYYFPQDDLARLEAEMRAFVERGIASAKIKIGGAPLGADLRRIETALAVLGAGDRLAVDAMNSYTRETALEAAAALEPYRLRWFEDVCDPLDYATHAELARAYAPPLSAGEALFSVADARNLLRYAQLRPGHDVLTFDPAHCYGLPEYLRIVEVFEGAGWSARDFQPHGGHLFSLHVAAGLGLGGSECNPHNFQPFGGFPVQEGHASPPEAPGIGFETKPELVRLFRSLAG